jgi:hypothetical protein
MILDFKRMAGLPNDTMAVIYRASLSGFSLWLAARSSHGWEETLDQILNDPEVPLDASKVWLILDVLEKNS